MRKRVRLFIVLLVLLICGAFLYPTFQWYFLIPREQKELALGSRSDIRAYSQRQANEGLSILKELAATNPQAPVPEELSFLVDKAKANYKLEKKELPKAWAVEPVLRSFRSEAEAYNTLESHYREKLLKLKDSSRGILQLGLDLSGGMSILLRADMDSLARRLERDPSEADKRDAIDQAMEILNNRIDQFGVTEPQIRKQGQNNELIEIGRAHV